MLTQRLEQKLLQKLSPQQIQLMKLLQVPAIALEQRIKEEIEINPALEEGEETEDEFDNMLIEDDYDIDLGDEREINNVDEEYLEQNITFSDSEHSEEFSISDYITDSDDYDSSGYNYQSEIDETNKEIPHQSSVGFHDFLLSQLGLHSLDDRQYEIALQIIGNIDDSGYMQRDINSIVNDLAFGMNIKSTAEEVEALLETIQQFDPVGVGARNLRECLLLQMKRLDNPSFDELNAILILDKYYDEFTKKHYDKIIEKSGISEDDIKRAINEILKLNPKPGNSINEASKMNHYIVPDFFIYNNEDELELVLNTRYSPQLRLNRTYLNMTDSTSYNPKKNSSKQKEAVQFAKQKIESAKWFIDALKQRENTLYLTMSTIMNFQYEYFLTGDDTKLKPMILKDIAEIVKLDISTISRVANSKYVQTPFGVFLLKSFFSEAMHTDSGVDVSSREIKKILQDCIESEDKKKPLADEALTEILQSKGYNVARRTVAKYREQLNIPVARLRKLL